MKVAMVALGCLLLLSPLSAFSINPGANKSSAHHDDQHKDMAVNGERRPKRWVNVLAAAMIGGPLAVGAGGGVVSQHTRSECADYGCDGHCWAYCGMDFSGGEWCYTTRSHSQSFEYEGCSFDHECSGCWSCAGSCTL